MKALKLFAIAAIAAVATTGFGADAMADGIGGVAENLDGQLGSIAKLISAAAFVIGLGFGASGLMKFKQHSENPNAVPISQPLVRIIVAAMLIALPAVLGVGIGTFFGEDGETTNMDETIESIDAR